MRGKRNSIFPVHPFDTHDSVICEFLGASDVLSELGWEIPVDLKADAHFDEYRSCPYHERSSSLVVGQDPFILVVGQDPFILNAPPPP
jgi:hypothetical protein